MTAGTQLAYPHTVRDIVQEYQLKHSRIAESIAAADQAIADLNSACSVGAYHESVARPLYINHGTAERILLSSAWQAIYKSLNLDHVFSATDKRSFERSLSDPVPLTLENLQATFGRYWENPRYYVLKGLAEVFCSLDKFYKSHSNFGFGVKGLPKRAILSNFRGWGSWGHDRLVDMCQAMLQVKPDLWLGDYVPEDERQDWKQVIRDNSHSWKVSDPFDLPQFGIHVKTFMNGNAHVHFNQKALELINDALHEFYGHVVPDDVAAPEQKQASTELTKDLQFYPTPKAVIERVLDEVHLPKGSHCLEPSCGEGAIMEALRKRGHEVVGIEYHPGRADTCRQKGFAVHTGNFLEVPPAAKYDAVVVNPPFYRTTWAKHVQQAAEWLKPGGRIIAILPATAEGSKLLPKGGIWTDLPMGSFRESGTNVNTGFYLWSK